MTSIHQNGVLDKLPVAELTTALRQFLKPVWRRLPDRRLQKVSCLAVQGILGGQSPQVTRMASSVARESETVWPLAKRLYRFLWNERFDHRDLLKGLYGVAQRVVARYQPAYLLVAVDPVNLEKPYTERLEGVSTVRKNTPPPPPGQKHRLTPGYPAITAAVVNLPEPVVTYANWFSYVTADFVSENREIYRALRITRALFPQLPLRFVGDAGLEDQKIFHQMDLVDAQFIIRACHERIVAVYNERLDRWEEELLDEALTATVPIALRLQVAFRHAGQVRVASIALGWLQIRLPETQQVLWALVAQDPDLDRQVVLLTNIPIRTAADAEMVYTEWRYRPQIEHTYRFDQEDGLDMEDMRVRTLERMRRLFVLVLLAALFVYHVAHTWPQQMVLWLRRLGGKLGRTSDRDGPYILLAGIQAVLITVATVTFAIRHPFPRGQPRCG
jgi:hypothetical protein